MATHHVSLVFWSIVAFLVLYAAAHGPLGADITIFNEGGWVVNGATDTGPNPREITVSAEGAVVGKFSELKVFYTIAGLGAPQIFSVKGSGALRPSLPPPGTFGGTFYATGYWDCALGFIQTMVMQQLDLRLGVLDPAILLVQGKATNLVSLEAPDWTLRFLQATAGSVSVLVSYTLVATGNVCVDQKTLSIFVMRHNAMAGTVDESYAGHNTFP